MDLLNSVNFLSIGWSKRTEVVSPFVVSVFVVSIEVAFKLCPWACFGARCLDLAPVINKLYLYSVI